MTSGENGAEARGDEIDVERVVIDPDYRRMVMLRLKEAATRAGDAAPPRRAAEGAALGGIGGDRD